MNLIFLILLFFSHAEVTNSPPSTATNEQQDLQDRINNLATKIKTLNERDLSCKKKTDCETLGVGYRSCGGLGNYIIISKKNHSREEILRAAEQHRSLSREYSERYPQESISVCSMALDPAFDCRNNCCVEVLE